MQTKHSSLFTTNYITFDDAKRYNLQTIDSVASIVKYFKEQGRKVFVIGVSYGAFLTQMFFWEAFSDGKQGSYDSNGENPTLQSTLQGTARERNMARLAAGVGYNRFTQRFANVDLSNVTYVYGTADEQLGKLTTKEVDFLKSKNANVIVSPLDHQPTFVQYVDDGCEKAFGIKIKTFDRGFTDEYRNLVYISNANGNTNENADTVILKVQGGPEGVPVTELETTALEKLMEGQKSLNNMLRLNLKQVQIQDPSKFNTSDITFDQAKQYSLDNVALLDKVVKYFKNQGRFVYLISEGYGASMILELISQKGTSVANGYIVFATRLDMNDVFWQGLSEGKSGTFTNIVTNGDTKSFTPVVTPVVGDQSEAILRRNINRLAAGLWYFRFSQKIKAILENASTNRILNSFFAYGLTDMYVGSLTDDEDKVMSDQFLYSLSAEEGSQSDLTNMYLTLTLKDAFKIKPKE
ncbi:hypothetical protein CHS0354_000691 [Potamilus streckersoni]|uniref:Uncharacterized protein n=1 Tax=Potamilus streckersoni TaxID=2493646 RepID=A0AAE0W859_9BIVA|nr:hypothetical protein CHS0354_000691 [Potamilus streckersoni]